MDLLENKNQAGKPVANLANTYYPIDFQLLFQISPNPYLLLWADAPQFTIAAVNDCYLIATGTQRQDILGRGIFEVFPDNPNDLTATGVSDLRLSLDRVIQSKLPDVMSIQRYDVPSKDAGVSGFKEKYWSPVNTPVFAEDGSVMLILHRVEDVTEFIQFRQHSSEEVEKVQVHAERMEAEVLRNAQVVKEANQQLKTANTTLETRERELAQLNENLQEIDQIKTAFFSNVSHEFRTPLTLMLGPLEEALNDKRGDANLQHERLDMVYRNALRLKKLVNTLLDFSRIEAGRIQACYQATDLSSFTQDLASMFRSAIEQAGLTLVLDCAPLTEPVYIDRDMWEKIVLNLISNAFKHTFEGSITLQLYEQGDHVALSLRDTGIGIPGEQLPHLFERFHRVPNARSRTHEGSGIGLALVQELVKLHGGTIQVESNVNEGTHFTIVLPTGKAHLPANQIESDAALTSTALGAKAFVEEAKHWLPQTNGERSEEKIAAIVDVTIDGQPVEVAWLGITHPGKARVLLADDNLDMRNYVSRLLQPYCEVEAVSDGSKALEAARECLPDLILSDIMMPQMDGFELLQVIRNDPALQSIPVILLSARAGNEAQVEGLEAGANDYLVKPFQAAELLARVKTNLDLQRVHYQSEMRERNAELEQRVVERTAELQALNQELESFSYSVSHDLRAPLRSINGFSHILLENHKDQLDEEGKGYLTRICTNTQQMGELMDALLTLSSINRSDLEKSEVNLSTLAQEITGDLKRQEPERCVDFHIQKNMWVHADASLMRAVLENLLGNAWKYTSKQAQAHIEFVQRDDRGQMAYCVQDNGAGFDMAFAGKLFGAFQRLHSNREFPGNGVGLATVSRIIQRHGGQVWAEGEVEKGSAFYFTLA
jgi:signal transduction histidine kinase